jgi:hypothetical protein
METFLPSNYDHHPGRATSLEVVRKRSLKAIFRQNCYSKKEFLTHVLRLG